MSKSFPHKTLQADLQMINAWREAGDTIVFTNGVFDILHVGHVTYLEAAKNNDMVEVADALGDMLYILCGTILEHGMQHKIEEVFNEIHTHVKHLD